MVPKCAGVKLADYGMMLDRRKLQLGKIEYVLDPKLTGGLIKSCAPKAGTTVAKNSYVDLFVVKAEDPMVEVPRIRYKSRKKIRKLFEKLGLKLGKCKYRTADAAPGTIIGQDIKPKTKVKKGTEIRPICAILHDNRIDTDVRLPVEAVETARCGARLDDIDRQIPVTDRVRAVGYRLELVLDPGRALFGIDVVEFHMSCLGC